MKLKPAKEGLKYSIIVVSFNAVEELAKCVQSLYKHTDNFELILVDNGSTDGSVGYIKNLEGLHENIKFIDNGKNLNFGPANNQGVKIAEGEYIICLNSDTIVTPQWADRLEVCLQHDPKAAIVGPVTNSSAGRQQVGDVIKNNSSDCPLDLDGAAILWGNNNHGKYQESGILYGWCLFIRRSFLEMEEFLFDDRFANAYEDNDLSLRAQLKGWKLYVDFGTFIWHRGQGSFRKSENFLPMYIENGRKNHELFLEKWKDARPKKLVAVYRIANCEKYVAKSLEQTSRFADEIICLFARSQDRTKEIAVAFPKVVDWQEWNEADHPFDEQAERNWLLQKAIDRGADWVISIDGDEVYENKFVEMVTILMNNPNPHIFGYWCNWRTIWEIDETGKEKYRADSTFGGFQNYRFFKVLPGMEIKANRNIYNHHCGSAPFIPAENLQWINVRVKHLGYDTPEQRKWKYDFYRKADPRPVIEDVGMADYHHLIDKNVQLKTYRENNRVSLMTVCKNEGELIFAMLSNVESIADEIVVVDTGSTDNTIAEVQRYAKSSIKPVRIFQQQFEQDEQGYILNYSEAKNWAKSKCRYEWILAMDADELFDPAHLGSIFGFIDEESVGFLFNVFNYLEPMRSPDMSKNVYSISESVRLYRNVDELFYSGLVHESLEDSAAACIDKYGRMIQSPIMLHHRGYLKKKDYIRGKVDRYHRINQRQYEVSGEKDPRPLFNMAMHYMNDGENDKAFECYQRCLVLQPNFWRARHNMAWHHLEMAKQYLNACIQQMPQIYKTQNTKVKEIIDVLNKFEFKVKKIC